MQSRLCADSTERADGEVIPVAVPAVKGKRNWNSGVYTLYTLCYLVCECDVLMAHKWDIHSWTMKKISLIHCVVVEPIQKHYKQSNYIYKGNIKFLKKGCLLTFGMHSIIANVPLSSLRSFQLHYSFFRFVLYQLPPRSISVSLRLIIHGFS